MASQRGPPVPLFPRGIPFWSSFFDKHGSYSPLPQQGPGHVRPRGARRVVLAFVAMLVIALCLFFWAVVFAAESKPGTVKNFVVFGDSYTDDCNLWRLANPPNVVDPYPFPTCPPAPTGRADGGNSWPEFIRENTDMRVINLAYSGATCNNTDFPRAYFGGGKFILPDVSSQIQQYLALDDISLKFPEETVAAIFIGTNDLGFFLQVFIDNRTSARLPPGVHITNEASCVVKQLQTLYASGLRRFLIFQTIPLESVGRYSLDVDNGRSQPGAFLSAFMAQLVSANNALQNLELQSIQGGLQGSEIQIFPTYEFYARRIADPKAFLGPNGTSTGFCQGVNGTCPNRRDFLFWDDLHPGLVANEQLARAVVAFINGQKNVTGPGI